MDRRAHRRHCRYGRTESERVRHGQGGPLLPGRRGTHGRGSSEEGGGGVGGCQYGQSSSAQQEDGEEATSHWEGSQGAKEGAAEARKFRNGRDGIGQGCGTQPETLPRDRTRSRSSGVGRGRLSSSPFGRIQLVQIRDQASHDQFFDPSRGESHPPRPAAVSVPASVHGGASTGRVGDTRVRRAGVSRVRPSRRGARVAQDGGAQFRHGAVLRGADGRGDQCVPGHLRPRPVGIIAGGRERPGRGRRGERSGHGRGGLRPRPGRVRQAPRSIGERFGKGVGEFRP
mmetsp:Transcript_14655/g.42976  ORF Transcript_14655/g.42976 Transcript_14655/m.42976 type:complete len:285 (-) Transcript_14655:304-1158(-)